MPLPQVHVWIHACDECHLTVLLAPKPVHNINKYILSLKYMWRYKIENKNIIQCDYKVLLLLRRKVPICWSLKVTVWQWWWAHMLETIVNDNNRFNLLPDCTEDRKLANEHFVSRVLVSLINQQAQVFCTKSKPSPTISLASRNHPLTMKPISSRVFGLGEWSTQSGKRESLLGIFSSSNN